MFEISASESGTVSMHKRMRVCANEFLARVSEGVIHRVYTVVIQSGFGGTHRHKVIGGIGRLVTVSQL